MGAHSNYLTLEGDCVTAIAFFILIIITILVIAIIDKYHNVIQQRHNKQMKLCKTNAIRQKMAHQRTLDNFYHNCVESDMDQIVSNPFELDDLAKNLVDICRS